jgi:hypothetical protein
MAEELTILEEGNIKVTSGRFIVGNQTFPVKNISSVRKATGKKTSGAWLYFIAAIGLLALGNNVEKTGYPVGGILLYIGSGALAALAIWKSLTAKAPFVVEIQTNAGKVAAVVSMNEKKIDRIIEALNKAVAA